MSHLANESGLYPSYDPSYEEVEIINDEEYPVIHDSIINQDDGNQQQVQEKAAAEMEYEENELQDQLQIAKQIELHIHNPTLNTSLLPLNFLRSCSTQNKTYLRVIYRIAYEFSKLTKRINWNYQFYKARQNLINQKISIKRTKQSTNTKYQNLELDFDHFVFR